MIYYSQYYGKIKSSHVQFVTTNQGNLTEAGNPKNPVTAWSCAASIPPAPPRLRHVAPNGSSCLAPWPRNVGIWPHGWVPNPPWLVNKSKLLGGQKSHFLWVINFPRLPEFGSFFRRETHEMFRWPLESLDFGVWHGMTVWQLTWNLKDLLQKINF